MMREPKAQPADIAHRPHDRRAARRRDIVHATVMNPDRNPTEEDRLRTVRDLRELIAALDRRVPHIERDGEIVIARIAAALREQALSRIAALEAEPV